MLSTPAARRLPLTALLLALVAMYLAKEVLVPVALAVLFSFLLGPQVRHLERRGIPRAVSVVLVTGVFFCLFSVIAWVTARQVIDLAAKVPTYRENIQSKLDSLRGEGGTLKQAADALANIDKKAEAAKPITGDPIKPPVDVRVVEPPASPPQFLRNFFGPLLAPLGTAGIVVIFTVFMLIERENLRNRLLHLAGPENLPITTQAINEAGERISRYLQAEVAVNLTMGVAVTGGLFLLHVPNAALWGLLTAIFRFVPYVGYWLSALAPLALSMAAFHDWWPVVWTAALFITLELITSNAIEPWVYGASTGLSPVAVVIAATFWTWLWGGVGLLLSTPLTVCIVVMGRYVPQFGFLHTLLGDEPAMPLNARLYQRLLAFDQEEVSELVETCLTTQTFAEFYDQVAIPALNQAQLDARKFALSDDRQQFIRLTLRSVAEELRERSAVLAKTDGEALPTDPVPPSTPPPVRVLILPVKTEADEIAALFFGHVLATAGIGSEVLPVAESVASLKSGAGREEVTMVFLSAVRPFAVMQARQLAKRLRAGAPELRIMVGLWDAKKPAETARLHLENVNAKWIGSTMVEALEQVCKEFPCNPEAVKINDKSVIDSAPL